jgi:hypothetical protein
MDIYMYAFGDPGHPMVIRHVSYGGVSEYMAVSPGTRTVQFTAPSARTAMPVKLAPDTVHTIVVLDSSSGLKVDALTDAAGSEMMPMGGVNTGFGGTAAAQSSDPTPWSLLIAAGILLAAAGLAGLRRSRRAAAR